MFCHVAPQQVIAVHDCSSVYAVPLLLLEQGVGDYLLNRLHITNAISDLNKSPLYKKWCALTKKVENLRDSVPIVIVGKYTTMKGRQYTYTYTCACTCTI